MLWAWIDLEMTGLSPDEDAILEIALIITDDALNVLHSGTNVVVHQPKSVLDRMSSFVEQMHTYSGLAEKVETSRVTLEQAEKAIVTILQRHVGKHRHFLLAGNSISTDRSFIRKHLPKLEAMLHYRQIDVTTVKLLVQSWFLNLNPFVKKQTHRALDDIKESIEELRYYKKRAFSAKAVID